MHISMMTLLVNDQDEAIQYYVDRLGFVIIEDRVASPTKRKVIIAPSMKSQMQIMLSRAANATQLAAVGKQAGDRVFLFLKTDDFGETYKRYLDNGVKFLENPRNEAYGTVVKFEDPYGNRWDLMGN